MHFELEQHLTAPPAQVEAAYLDPALLERLADLPDLGRPELLDYVEEDDTVRRRVRFRFMGHLSPAVTAVVDPARLSWVEESVHDRSTHRGAFRMLPDHYPDRLRCAGTVALHPVPDGTRRVCSGHLTVRFPLVAGKVERAIVSGMRRHAEAEARVVQEWLAGGGA